MTEPIVASLASITFVYARDPVAGRSQNTSTAIALGDAYADYVVITHHPHDPSTFDLARDYTDFVDRPVTTEYLDQLVGPR